MITAWVRLRKYSLNGWLVLTITLGMSIPGHAHEFDPAHAPQGKDSIKVLVDKLPKDRDVFYVSGYEADGSTSPHPKPIAVVKAMRNDGTGKDSILEVEYAPLYSISPSPDGKSLLLTVGDLSSEDPHLAHSWLNVHIWIYKDGKVAQLTRGMVRDVDVIWSASGDKIYFARSQVSVLEPDGLNSGAGNVWSIALDGSNARQLTFSSKEDVVNITPVPTPDGKKINFTTNRNSKWQIFSMNTDGSNQKIFIGDGMQGNWSRDGNTFVYLDNSPGDIYLADKTGKMIRKLTNERKIPFAPSWSPDGRYLLYSRVNGDVAYTHEQQGENSVNGSLTEPPQSRPEEPLFDIWKMPIDKPSLVQKLTNDGLINSFPFWITLSSPTR